MMIMLAGAAPFALDRRDVDRIETDTGRRVEDLTDRELLASMERLGIRPAADAQEKKLIPTLPSQCAACGRPLTMDTVEWNGPMSANCPACGSGVEVAWSEL